jgi:hypothetical protein
MTGEKVLARRLLAAAEVETGRQDAGEIENDDREVDAPL